MADTQTVHDTVAVTGDAEFKQLVLESKLPVIVDFYADWCGPCKLAAPIMERLATEFKGEAVIVKLDVEADGNRTIAQQYGVMSIPTVISFKGGQVVDNVVGFIGEPGYRSMLDKAMAA